MTVILTAEHLTKSYGGVKVVDDLSVSLAEGEALEREAETYSHVVQEHYQRALLRKESAPPPESLYLGSEEFTRFVTAFDAQVKAIVQEAGIEAK